jgi:ubiquinone/menaquinone biosynthesis C-methylase UbiE
MSARTQEALAVAQFGPQAAAYVTSAVHAQGADLAALARLADGAAGGRALDLGSGGGHVAYAVAPKVAEVTAYDPSEQMLAAVTREAASRGLANVRTVQGGAEALPFADASFECVFSRYSAHHWRDFEAGLREAARVLKPGGQAGFVDVVSPGRAAQDTFLQAVEVLRDTSHVRDRSRAEWEAALTAVGFVVGAVTPFRVRLGFAEWIARLRTPPEMATAIRALQAAMADEVRRHFAVEADGSFTIDVVLFAASKPA